MGRFLTWIAWVGMLLSPVMAAAVPPDKVVQLQVGQDWTATHLAGEWQAFSEDPEVVSVQVLRPESGESGPRQGMISNRLHVYCKALKPGQVLVVLSNRKVGQVEFWQMQVDRPLSTPGKETWGALQTACHCQVARPDLLRCRIETPACLDKIRESVRGTTMTTAQVEFSYALSGLQALLAQMQEQLVQTGLGSVRLSFEGVNLRLDGKLAPGRWNDLVQVMYSVMVGRLMLVDKLADSG